MLLLAVLFSSSWFLEERETSPAEPESTTPQVSGATSFSLCLRFLRENMWHFHVPSLRFFHVLGFFEVCLLTNVALLGARRLVLLDRGG